MIRAATGRGRLVSRAQFVCWPRPDMTQRPAIASARRMRRPGTRGLWIAVICGACVATASPARAVPGDELWSSEFANETDSVDWICGGSNGLAACGDFEGVPGFAMRRSGRWQALDYPHASDEHLFSMKACAWLGSQLVAISSYAADDPRSYAPYRFRQHVWDGSDMRLTSVMEVDFLHDPLIDLRMFTVNARLLMAYEGAIVDATGLNSWTLLASVAGGRVRRMTSWKDQLTVVGPFTAIAGVPAQRLATLGPGGWQEVGGGFYGVYPCVAEWHGSLFVSGELLSVGSLPVRNIAAYDGASWDALLGGIDGPVYAMLALPCGLIAAGDFDTAGGVAAANIALWDGAKWSPLGSGTNGYISSLAWWNGCLYVSGDFTLAGGKPAMHLSAWRPASVPVFLRSFSAVRLPVGQVRLEWEIATPTEGVFRIERTSAGGATVALTGAASAERTRFELLDLDTPASPLVYCLYLRDRDSDAGELIGELQISGRATPSATRLEAPTPNPFNPRVTLAFGLARAGSARLAVYDARGRLIRDLLDAELPVGEHAVTWDGKDSQGVVQSSGVYVVRLVSEDCVDSAKLNLVR
jgi:hypothetical protein